jgi:PAS domain S-box-containing protein
VTTDGIQKITCWEFFSCSEKDCPVYHADDRNCWLVSSTHCHNQIQGKFLDKIEMCLDCQVFNANIDASSLKATLKIVSSQYKDFRQAIEARDMERENTSMEFALSLSEVFEALKKIAAGDPTVRLSESSDIEIIEKLKQIINLTAAEIGEIVDQSHEFAMGLAEHFDVLHKVSQGNLNARVSGNSSVELLESLKRVTNQMIGNISSDMREKQQAEASLRKLEDLESSILSTIPHAVVGLRNRSIIFANDSVEEVFGWRPEEIVGRKTRIFYRNDKDFELIGKRFYPVLEKQQTYSEEFPCRHRDGRDMICRVHASVIGNTMRDKQIVVMYADVTERKKLEAQLKQAQKMEAIGTLAGGVAHDFNNILTAIISYGNILLMKMSGNDPHRMYAERILNASEKATSLVHSLLAFSRKQIMNSKPVSINGTIRKLELLLMRLIGEDIDLGIHLDERELVVLADAGQIEQVLMNLATNARDAMPDVGTISIHSEMILLDNEFVKVHGYGEPGRYAMITVSDTGEGMDETIRERIFEPFFTTKEVGKGTGLGLAMAYGIIKQHDGYITCYSEPGRGTTFKIYLPLINEKAEAEETSFTETSLYKGHEIILVAEDNADVRKAEKEILTESGYTVIESEDGDDAIKKFAEDGNRHKIDLLILDVIMPKKNGKEVYDAIRKENPHVRAIFTSGYTADIIQRRGILEEGSDFIMKPFLPHKLLEKVRTVLDSRCVA